MFELAQVVLKKRVSNNYLDMSLYRARFLSMYDTHGPLEKKKWIRESKTGGKILTSFMNAVKLKRLNFGI